MFLRHYQNSDGKPPTEYTAEIEAAADRLLEFTNAYYYLNNLQVINEVGRGDLNHVTPGTLLATFGYPNERGYTSGGYNFAGVKQGTERYFGDAGRRWGSAVLHLNRWWQARVNAVVQPHWDFSEQVDEEWEGFAARSEIHSTREQADERIRNREKESVKEYREIVKQRCMQRTGISPEQIDNAFINTPTTTSIAHAARAISPPGSASCATLSESEIDQLPGLGGSKYTADQNDRIIHAAKDNFVAYVSDTYQHQLVAPAEKGGQAYTLADLLKPMQISIRPDLAGDISANDAGIVIGTKSFMSTWRLYTALFHECYHFLQRKLQSILGNNFSARGVFYEGNPKSAEEHLIQPFLTWMRANVPKDNPAYYDNTFDEALSLRRIESLHFNLAILRGALDIMSQKFDEELWNRKPNDTVAYVKALAKRDWDITDPHETDPAKSKLDFEVIVKRSHMGYQILSYSIGLLEVNAIIKVLHARLQREHSSNFVVDVYSLLACGRVKFDENETGLERCLPVRPD